MYDILIAEYTYEECKRKRNQFRSRFTWRYERNLRGFGDRHRENLSNNSADPAFNTALNETQKNLGVSNNDNFITLFEKTYKKMSPNGRLAPLFQSIENKNKITYNSSNEEVIAFIRDRVAEAVNNAEKTFAAVSTALV